MNCSLCFATVPTVDVAIALDWHPSYYVEGEEFETGEPVCPWCVRKHLIRDDATGEYILPVASKSKTALPV